MADDKITQEDAASYLESDAYARLPQPKKDEVIKYLKTNMVRQTMGTPNTSGDVLKRREQTGGMTDEKTTLGHLASGITTGVENVASTPGAIYHAAKDQPTDYEKGRHLRHPFAFAEPQRGVGLTLDRLFFDSQFEQAGKAHAAFQEGNTREGLARTGFALTPAGPIAAHFAEQADKNGWTEALGEQAIYALTGLAIKHMTKGVDPSKRLSAATGGGAKEFESVMGDLARGAKKYGKPKTVSDLYELVKKTGRDMETDFNTALQPIAGSQVMPSDVAASLLKEADKFDRHTPEGRAARLYLRQRALDYQHPWSLGDLNQKRMKMLDATLEAKTQVKQMGAVRNNVETMADKTIEDSLREIVYGEMDKRYKGANFKGLKEKQAKLLDLNHRLQNRVSDIADKQAAYEAAGPLKRAGFYVRGHASGLTPAVHPKFEGSPEKAAGKQIKKAFSRLRNPIAAKPSPKRSLPPLEPDTPPKPQTPPKSSPSATTGHSEGDVDEVTRRGPGADPEAAAARARQAEFLRTKRENLAEQRKEVPDKASDIRKQQEQGGHAGGGVSSVEELSRKGTNYVVSKSGKLTYHGKSFAPESTPSGSTHVTVLPDGSFRVNAGEKLSPAQESALREAGNKTVGKSVTVQGKPATVIGTHPGTNKVVVKTSDGSIVRADPSEIKQGLTPLESPSKSSQLVSKKFLTQKQITENMGRTVTSGGKKGEIVGFPVGRVKLRLSNGELITVDWSDIEEPLK